MTVDAVELNIHTCYWAQAQLAVCTCTNAIQDVPFFLVWLNINDESILKVVGYIFRDPRLKRTETLQLLTFTVRDGATYDLQT